MNRLTLSWENYWGILTVSQDNGHATSKVSYFGYENLTLNHLCIGYSLFFQQNDGCGIRVIGGG